MPSIEGRLKDLLDETRLAMLGTQLLIGLQYNAAFSPGFAALPTPFRWLAGVALLFILATAALLLATPAFHHIAEGGHATARMLAHASNNLKFALAPLSIALGIDISIGFVSAAGARAAALAGAIALLGALFLWYALPLRSAMHKHRESDMQDEKQSLEARIVQALTELRVILPGAQALFGFQFAAVLTTRFARLPPVSKGVHLVSLALVAVAVVMLIAPAAYHRIAAGGNAEDGVLRYAVHMMLPAVGLLALGMVGDAYVTVRLILESHAWALAVALLASVMFVSLLYLIPVMARSR